MPDKEQLGYVSVSSVGRDIRLFVQDDQPDSSQVKEGYLWSDTSAPNALRRATDSSTFVAVGSGTGTMTTVKESGSQVGGADIIILDFGAGFDITESPDKEINILVDVGEVTTGVLPVAQGGTDQSSNLVIDAFISGGSLKGMATNPSGDSNRLAEDEEHATNDVNADFMLYDAVNEQAYFQYVLPKGWNAGTVAFTPIAIPTAGSGTWAFELAAVAIGDNVDPDVAYGTGQTSTDTLQTAGRIHIGPESSAITIGNTPAKEEIMFFRLKLTTLNVTAVKLYGLRLHFTRDTYTDA